MEKLKLALIGTQCTGKSSILKNLDQKYQQYVSQSLTRKMINDNPGLPCNQNGDTETQWRFFDLYYDLFDTHSQLISDRSMIDVIAYTLWLCKHDKINFVEFEKMIDLFVGFSRRDPLTMYIYIPISFPIKADGVRDTDEVYRKELDDCYRIILNELSDLEWFKCMKLESTTVEDRVKEVTSVIKDGITKKCGTLYY